MTWTKPRIIDVAPSEEATFAFSFGPFEDVYRITITEETGRAWIVDFDALGMIVSVEPSGFDTPPEWQDASRAIRFALTTYLMNHNT